MTRDFWHYSGDAGTVVFQYENNAWREYVLTPNLPFLSEAMNEQHRDEIALPVYDGTVPPQFRKRAQ